MLVITYEHFLLDFVGGWNGDDSDISWKET